MTKNTSNQKQAAIYNQSQSPWDYQELSAFLKLSPNTLRKWVMQRKIPFYKIGGAVRFSPEKIHAWLEQQAVDAGGE
ncbi:MAG: helix-turn-helix domain-containing protein [bacterium]|nr:helix-turn-helix domain-containing protein [bacterium]